MSGDLGDIIRSLAKESQLAEREKHREELYNKARVVESGGRKGVSSADLRKLVGDLKRGSESRQATLASLKAAFIQDRLHMLNFLKIEGALHSLVRNLMSQEPYIQLLAAECCCNLSLGDGKTCYQLAKAASPYLVSILHGLNYNLMNYSLLTLGNMCATSNKAVKLIKSQGALPAFQETILIPELREPTAFALIMFTKSSLFNESPELVEISTTILQYLEESLNVQWLIYHLTTIDSTRDVLLEQNVAERIVSQLETIESVDQESVQSLTCLLRALANLVSEESGKVALVLFGQWSLTFKLAKRLLKSNYKHLHLELAWLLGNLINHPSALVQDKVLLNEPDLNWLGKHFPK